MPTKHRDLSKEEWNIFQCTNYRGCIIWKKDSGYNWGGRTYPSQEDLDKAIDGACEVINKSITVKNNNGSMSVDGKGK